MQRDGREKVRQGRSWSLKESHVIYKRRSPTLMDGKLGIQSQPLWKGSATAPKSDCASWLVAVTKMCRNLDFSLMTEKHPKSGYNFELQPFTLNTPENNLLVRMKTT